MLSWHRSVDRTGYVAETPLGSYEARRLPDGSFRVYLDGDFYGDPVRPVRHTLRDAKEVCQGIQDERDRRHVEAGGDLPAPVQPTLAQIERQAERI